MVLRRGHRVAPHIIGELQVLADLLTSHTEDEQQILETVELEHIALCHIACLDNGIEGEWGVERYVGFRDLQLQVMDQISEC